MELMKVRKDIDSTGWITSKMDLDSDFPVRSKTSNKPMCTSTNVCVFKIQHKKKNLPLMNLKQINSVFITCEHYAL